MRDVATRRGADRFGCFLRALRPPGFGAVPGSPKGAPIEPLSPLQGMSHAARTHGRPKGFTDHKIRRSDMRRRARRRGPVP